MSQEKAQLIAPIGHFTVPGLNVAGVVTATSFSGNCTGTASSITKGASLVVGVMTATSFVGDVTGNVTGIGSNTDNLDVGIVTATSFAGNFTGIGSGLTGTPNVVAGVVTATKFVGNTPGTVSKLSDGTNINVGVVTATKFVGNTSGLAGGISAAQNINVGVLTATGGLYGDGSGLTGAGSTAYIRQDVTAVSGTTTINLNDGNIIYLTHSNNTTIAFSNVPTATDVTIIRSISANTITWPAAITWNGGSEPSISDDPSSNTRFGAAQVFNLVTYNGGTNWYGYEEYDYNPEYYDTWSWGYNLITGIMGASGILTPANQRRSSPTQIPGTRWTKKFSVKDSAYGIKDDGTLWCMGQNTYGQLANNTNAGSWAQGVSSPIQIPGTNWASIEAHGSWANATKTDGTLWAWGANSNGQLGVNDTVHRSSPVQVPGTTWQTLLNGSIGGGIKTDGTLWNWGGNSHGILGHNESPGSRPGYSSPVQMGTATNWQGGSCGGAVNFMFKTTGEMWAAGHQGEDRSLGLNSGPTNHRSSPAQIPGTTWSKVVSSGMNTHALKTDGTLWSWGDNEMGQGGYGPAPSQMSSPKQVPGTTWLDVSPMSESTMGLKTDGTLWTWGANEGGELGHNITGPAPTVRVTSPQQIPGTNWKACFSGDRVMFAFQEPS